MLSRLGQSSLFAGGLSLYETLRQQDDDDSDNPDDLEAGVGMRAARHDEELEGPNDYELRAPLDLTESQYSQTGPRQQSMFGARPRSRSGDSPRLNYMSAQLPELDTEADEVPASLLVERTGSGAREHQRDVVRRSKVPAHSTLRQGGPAKPRAHAHWAESETIPRRGEQLRTQAEHHQARMGLIDPKQRALWKWANVENLDNFLHDVCQSSQLRCRKSN